MTPLLLLALIMQVQPPASELGDTAVDLFSQDDYAGAFTVFRELFSRMPHNGRIAYNLAASGFMLESFPEADSLLRNAIGDVPEDTLSTAMDLTALAMAIQADDYGAVETAVENLSRSISAGDSPRCERTGLEAGMNWLENHEPPEDQQDQEDQEDQDDQSDDQEEQQDQDDQSDDTDDRSDDQEDQQDQDDQSDDREDGEEEDSPQPPPSMDEMTPEQAQAILDMVQEDQPQDSTGTGKAGQPAGPVW